MDLNDIASLRIKQAVIMFYPQAFEEWNASEFNGFGQFLDEQGCHITNSLCFSVSGNKFTGEVLVYHIEDRNFRIECWKCKTPFKAVLIKKSENVPFYDLASELDTLISG
ncbi:hypothetical protein ACFL5V_13675 [Fibrobacterota bacterium]